MPIDKFNNDPEWLKKMAYSSFDYFGTPEGFSASGDCWQKIGEHGTFDLKQAKAGLKWISKRNKDHKFRIVEISVTQSSVPLRSPRAR